MQAGIGTVVYNMCVIEESPFCSVFFCRVKVLTLAFDAAVSCTFAAAAAAVLFLMLLLLLCWCFCFCCIMEQGEKNSPVFSIPNPS